jgi:DNA-binding GntR family transcriptional regulator
MLIPMDNHAESLAERAVNHIRSEVAAGALGPGSRINELEIAHRLNVSRGPVREAVRSLTARGLLVAEPNVGARITPLDPELVCELYDVREALESLAARLAAEHMSEDERAQLLALLARHEEELQGKGPRPYPAGGADHDFHLLILKGSKNRMVWRICGIDLRDLLTLVRRQHHMQPDRSRRALTEHKRIAEAVVERNGEVASLLMAQHISASRHNLLGSMPLRPVTAGKVRGARDVG